MQQIISLERKGNLFTESKICLTELFGIIPDEFDGFYLLETYLLWILTIQKLTLHIFYIFLGRAILQRLEDLATGSEANGYMRLHYY